MTAAALSVVFLSGCKKTDPIKYDESGYSGTYVGYHHLDSVALSVIVGASNDFSYWDTLTVTRGTDSTDGKIQAVSSLLNGKTIEIDLSKTSSNVTPVYFGTINILGAAIQNCKITSGNATWDAGKATITTALVVTVDFPYNGTLVNIPGLKLNGSFVKQ